jgi:hypothetical protein
MKYIELSEGLSVAIDKIEAVQDDLNGMGSKVYTITGAIYDCDFPRKLLLELIETGQIDNTNNEVLEELKKLNGNAQHFSG